MKTFAANEKLSAPAVRKVHPYAHYPMGPAQRRRQAEIHSILHSTGAQAKLTIGQPNDIYEQEADSIADQVMSMPDQKLQRQPELEEEEEPLQTKSLADQITPFVQRQEEPPEEEEEEPVQAKFEDGGIIQRMCPACEEETAQRQPMAEEDEELQAKEKPGQTPQVGSGVESRINSLKGGGQPLDSATRSFFEPRFGHNFSGVRVHHGGQAADISRSINARAFTLGNNVVFGSGEYAPRSSAGKRLLGHELTHVVQQLGSLGGLRPIHRTVQRTIGDGHDLSSPRFTKLLDLEAAYDDESWVKMGSSGRDVQAIQHALYDLGFSLPKYGADGEFGARTKKAVKAYQRANPPLQVDGIVGPKTMEALDTRFGGAPVLPSPAVLSAAWTPACVRSVLCPWSPHTIDVLRGRITLKSFDSISWADEEWNGANWIPAPFPGGGYQDTALDEIGVLNSSCESMSETLYHEVLHAEQPTTHRTTREKETYAYRIGEEFSVAMGLGGRSSLRSTDAQGREFADPTKVDTFVATTYPSVPSGGGGDEIVGKAATNGHVRVKRPNGSIYTRPAAVGEKVPGPINLVNEVTHPTAGWTCP